jgi:uncharacterized protein (TIGR00255 family)
MGGTEAFMRSMTGYGQAILEREGREVTVELKSVNHRFLDLNVRLPRALFSQEEEIKRVLGAVLSRGHVDITITYRNSREDAKSISLDEPLLRAYARVFQRMAQVFAEETSSPITPPTFRDITHLPELLHIETVDPDPDAITALLREAVALAAQDLIVMREAEGAALSADLDARLATLAALRTQIEARAPLVVTEYRERLQHKLSEFLGQQLDPQRMAMEVAFLTDRAAIDEELTRLASHLDQLRTLVRSDQAVGRKLDFLVQELNREVNTIGSKAADARIASLVLEAKGEIEKVREQVQNVE